LAPIEEAYGLLQPDWACKRLLLVRLIAQHKHTVAEIMKVAGVVAIPFSPTATR
jgi:hypothetical protein